MRLFAALLAATACFIGTADAAGDGQQVPLIYTFDTYAPTAVALTAFTGRSIPALFWLLLVLLPAAAWLYRRRRLVNNR